MWRRSASRNARIDISLIVSVPDRGPELEFCLEQAGAGLEKVVADSLRRMPADEATLTAWPLVCGSVVAERTRALDFAGGVLRVEVADAGWRRELQVLASRYLATINRYTIESVQRIEFVIASSSK